VASIIQASHPLKTRMSATAKGVGDFGIDTKKCGAGALACSLKEGQERLFHLLFFGPWSTA
jgi:hypothetical protein